MPAAAERPDLPDGPVGICPRAQDTLVLSLHLLSLHLLSLHLLYCSALARHPTYRLGINTAL